MTYTISSLLACPRSRSIASGLCAPPMLVASCSMRAARGSATPGWLVAAAAALFALSCELRLRRLSVLLARAGHELRGSLCTAELALDALALPAVRAELRRAATALDHLTHPPVTQPTPVDATTVIRECAPAWHALARAHGADLRLDLPPTALRLPADRDDLARALRNLIANAAEHGAHAAGDGPRIIRLRVSVAPRADGAPHGGDDAASSNGHDARRAPRAVASAAVRIQVADDGPGLPAPLGRLLARGRSRRGARGHGLAIVDDFAARHGGRLFTAPSARGARLVLELPVAPVRESRRRPALTAS